MVRLYQYNDNDSFLFSLAMMPHNLWGVYGEICTLLGGYIEIVKFQYLSDWNDALYPCYNKTRDIYS